MSSWVTIKNEETGKESVEYDIATGRVPKHVCWGNTGSVAHKFLCYGLGNILGSCSNFIDLLYGSGFYLAGLKPKREDSSVILSNKFVLVKNYYDSYSVLQDIVDIGEYTESYNLTFEGVYSFWAKVYTQFYYDQSVYGIINIVANLVNQEPEDIHVIDQCNFDKEAYQLLFSEWDNEGVVINEGVNLSESEDKIMINQLSDYLRSLQVKYMVADFDKPLGSWEQIGRWKNMINELGEYDYHDYKPFVLGEIMDIISKSERFNLEQFLEYSEQLKIFIKIDEHYSFNLRLLYDVLKYVLPLELGDCCGDGENAPCRDYKIIGY